MSYGVFAEYYDLFTKNVDYAAYAERVDKIAGSLGLKRGSLVDLGCGTASLGIELARLGYDVTGVDLSCEMLTAAAAKVYDSGLFVRLVNMDMRALKLPEKADMVVSSLDGLNHLDGFSDVKKTFARVYSCLAKGGLFVFVMNTPYKHKEVLSNNAFIFDSDEAYLGWQNEYCDEDKSVEITLDFFVPDNSGGYDRFTECFKERAYSERDVCAALRECGFELAGMYDGLSADPPKDTTQRILYAAIKPKNK